MAEHRTDKRDGWQRYNWALIEHDYITSVEWQGLRKIAKKYGCNIKTVEKHSAQGHWYQKRINYMAAVVKESMIMSHMKRAEPKVLEALNEELVSVGLDPVTDIGKEIRTKLRKEIERLY